ncbi:hypothetical protein Q3G72_022875 [Acer saccharum]|nr:hypothetical protein Q3G72_022875 [Acer saccharum]
MERKVNKCHLESNEFSLTKLNGSILLLLSNAGGRLVIASDGIWDALSSDMAAQSCWGLPAELAAKLVVKVMSSIGSFF